MKSNLSGELKPHHLLNPNQANISSLIELPKNEMDKITEELQADGVLERTEIQCPYCYRPYDPGQYKHCPFCHDRAGKEPVNTSVDDEDREGREQAPDDIYAVSRLPLERRLRGVIKELILTKESDCRKQKLLIMLLAHTTFRTAPVNGFFTLFNDAELSSLTIGKEKKSPGKLASAWHTALNKHETPGWLDQSFSRFLEKRFQEFTIEYPEFSVAEIRKAWIQLRDRIIPLVPSETCNQMFSDDKNPVSTTPSLIFYLHEGQTKFTVMSASAHHFRLVRGKHSAFIPYAKSLLTQLELRNTLLHALAELLIKKQSGFFSAPNRTQALAAIRVLKHRDLDADQSRVTRLLQNDFAQTPCGAFPLGMFFPYKTTHYLLINYQRVWNIIMELPVKSRTLEGIFEAIMRDPVLQIDAFCKSMNESDPLSKKAVREVIEKHFGLKRMTLKRQQGLLASMPCPIQEAPSCFSGR